MSTLRISTSNSSSHSDRSRFTSTAADPSSLAFTSSTFLHTPHTTHAGSSFTLSASSAVQLDYLRITCLRQSDESKKEAQGVTSALSRCLLRCPPLRSCPLPQSDVAGFSALQSLYVEVDTAVAGILGESDCLQLMPQLSELTIRAETNKYGAVPLPPLLLPSLPTTLTYFHLHCTGFVAAAQRRTTTIRPGHLEVDTALPPSLLCLSLRLVIGAFSDTLVSSLPSQCPRLTHCHLGVTRDNGTWPQRLPALRDRFGAAVWCETEEAVLEQRPDQRWQCSVGVRIGQ